MVVVVFFLYLFIPPDRLVVCILFNIISGGGAKSQFHMVTVDVKILWDTLI